MTANDHTRLDKKTREQLQAYCGRLGEDDAIDPREFSKARQVRNRQNRKTLQLCKQVAVTLELILSGEFGDEHLQSLEVLSVTPDPNASQLAVTVRPMDKAVGVDETTARLEAVAGRLRSEVAAAITRKRAPRLVFRVRESGS